MQKRIKGSERLQVLPYTARSHPSWPASDVIMGKAGPNMLFESMVLGKPFIATSYIPAGTTQSPFYPAAQPGWVALDPYSQLELVRSLIQQPER